jgi:DNA modification methylase
MIKLMQGDCLERMKEIESGSVDLTVTSPPYDNLRTYNGNNALWSDFVWRSVINDLYRITKDGGCVVWVVGDATIRGSETGSSFRQALYAKEIGFNLHDTMIYEKGFVAFPESVRYNSKFEYMFIFSKGKPKTFKGIKDHKNVSAGRKVTGFDRSPDGSRGKRTGLGRVCPDFSLRGNVWKMWNQSRGEHTKHPATFPYQLPHDHIISWSNDSETVFDPFMGSGTTGVAAINTGRKFIGIELDEHYFQIAQNRINEALSKKAAA